MTLAHPPSRQRSGAAAAATTSLAGVHQFAEGLRAREVALRKRGRAEVDPALCEEATAELFDLVDRLEVLVGSGQLLLSEARCEVDRILTPILCRSPLFWRSRFKPHGYAGDFRIIEEMYDLEVGLGQNATQPAFLNLLAYSFARVHSVVGLWQRRKYIAGEVRRRTGQRLRVLDIACGGARYLVDALLGDAGRGVDLVLVDQDPAALNFAAERLRACTLCRVDTLCMPLKRLLAEPLVERFDLVISAGLFDYLETETAAQLAHRLGEMLAPQGAICITNFGPGDRSAFFKTVVVDWTLVYRSEHDLQKLLPLGCHRTTATSEDGSLTYALAEKV